MRIFNTCLVWQDSVLQTGVYASEPTVHFLCSTARFRQDISAAWFSVVSCSDAVVNVFYSPVLTRSLIFLQLQTAVS